ASFEITTSTSRRWLWSPTPRWAISWRSWRRTLCRRRSGISQRGKSRWRGAGSCREAPGVTDSDTAAMSDTSQSHTARGDADEVAAFYARGRDRGRLGGGQGALESARPGPLLERYPPGAPAVVADVGGGPGRYAVWLAERGYRVHLIDPVPLHVEQARADAGDR